MTDKQIIIDGVDVSGCDFLAKEDDYYSYNGEYRAYKGQCGCSDEEMCKDHPNCFYKKALKQLKSKEQEVQQAMDNYVQLDLQRVKEYNELVDLYKAKEQECEALQMSDNEAGEIIAELKAYKDINEDFKTAWEELKAENNELKKIINEAKNSKLDLKSFLVGEAVQNEYEQQLDQLKQTLAEIKEIAEKQVKRAPDGETFARPEIKQILQKISEVEK